MRPRKQTPRRPSAVRMRSRVPPRPSTAAATAAVAVVVVAVAFLCQPHPAYGSAVARPAADHDKLRKLFEFVLVSDHEWAPVLRQKVRLENVAPGLLPPRPVYEETVAAITPLAVLRKALDEYAAFGSFATYGSYVLRTAFGCFAHAHVVLLMDLVAAVDDECRRADADGGQEHRPRDACPGQAVTRDALSVIMAMVDNVAAVRGNLGLLADAFDRHASPGRVDADSLRDAFRPVRDTVQQSLLEDCVDVAADDLDVDRACARLSVDSQEFLRTARAAGKSESESAEMLLRTVTDLLLKVYESLYVDTFPADVWRQILDVPDHVKIEGMGIGRKISHINVQL